MLPDIGCEGQTKLSQARVLVVGVGGLGSPISLYLTAAGVGHIGIIDNDVVSHSNLQRQVLYHEADVGKDKVKHTRLCRI
ncbi:MAG: ThiF family adenylyltransferase [Mycoplasmataceae bacterium]|nr:ThiF family adenylyltransferase [Mycoplasmataceae bacterium]